MPQFSMFFPSNINMKCYLKYFSIYFVFFFLKYYSRIFVLKRAQEIMHQKETEREKSEKKKREGGRERKTAFVNKDSKIRKLLILMI